MEKEERSRLEKHRALQAAEQFLENKDFSDWRACAQNVRYKTHRNRTFLVWEVVEGQPVIIDTFRSVDIEASFNDGLRILMRSVSDEFEMWVTHRPQRLANYGVFLHVPFLPDTTFLDSPGKRQTLRVPIVFKMAEDPARLVEGVDYMTDVMTYTTLFPSEMGRTF